MLLKKNISIRYFIDEIKWQILLIVLFSLLIGFLHVRPVFRGLNIPINVLTMVGTVVSLLLAFRTSQSYERWWEARIIWGGIVNDSRTLMRLVIQFLPNEATQEKTAFGQRQIVWVFALGESLRKLPFSTLVENYLSENKMEAVNIPNALLDKHAQQLKDCFKEGKIDSFQQMQINEVLGRLCDGMGKCERIKSTVFPQAYNLILHTLIYVFIFILPFSLEHNEFFMEIVICIIIPILFVAVEKTAILMQDPFENKPMDTPMTSIAQTIEINIKQSLGETNLPQKPINNTYFEM